MLCFKSCLFDEKKTLSEASLNFINYLDDSIGKENTRSSTENERRSTEGQGKVRECAAGDQSVQSEIHGRHDSGVWEVPRNGSSEIAVLQRRFI